MPDDHGTRRARGPQAPFAALPRNLAGDPTLPPLDKAILLVLAGFAFGDKVDCWPSNATIAAQVGRSVGHVKRRLAALEARGLIARAATDDNRTGRVLRLCWRAAPGAPASVPTGPAARPESEEGEEKNERPAADSGPEKGPPPPADVADLDQLARWAAGADPVLARIGRAGLAAAGVALPPAPCPAPAAAPPRPSLPAAPRPRRGGPIAIDRILSAPFPVMIPVTAARTPLATATRRSTLEANDRAHARAGRGPGPGRLRSARRPPRPGP